MRSSIAAIGSRPANGSTTKAATTLLLETRKGAQVSCVLENVTWWNSKIQVVPQLFETEDWDEQKHSLAAEHLEGKSNDYSHNSSGRKGEGRNGWHSRSLSTDGIAWRDHHRLVRSANGRAPEYIRPEDISQLSDLGESKTQCVLSWQGYRRAC